MYKNEILNSFFTGVNYWGSESAINMWTDFNADSIENDMKLMRDAGITHLRVFPLWPVFQPLKAIYGPLDVYEYTMGEEPLPDTPAGRAGVSEEACRKFEIFCDIAKKYDMKLIVALITGHMSFRLYTPPAFEGKEILSDPTVIKWQLRFVKYFVTRFKSRSEIVGWDLGNETSSMPGLANRHYDTFYVWSCTIADAVRCCDSERPVISGLDDSCSIEKGYANLKDVGEICDMHTTHPYNIFCTNTDPLNTMKPILDLAFKCRLGEDISGIPTFVQEYGSIGYMNCSQKTEADFYRASVLACLAHGCYGTMWWCAFDQGHHNYAPYRWNTIGSDYGFFDKDLNEKPLAEENRKFKELLSKLPEGNLPPHTVNATIIVPREESNEINLLRTTYLLAKQANLDVRFNYALDPIADSPLYILPSVKHYKSITKNRFDELLEKVRAGSVLYICADEGLIRYIPDITGVEIQYREDVSETRTMMLNGKELPIHTRYTFKAECIDAEVVAVDNENQGVFFKHAYGKGYIYFLTLPLEAYLTDKKGAFFKDNQPVYSDIYRELAKTAGISRLCDSDNPYIRLTEHIAQDGTVYVVAINYNNKEETAVISMPDGYSSKVIYGAEISRGILTLGANEGAVFVFHKTI